MKHISAVLLLMIASLIVSGSAIAGTPGLLGLKTPTGNIQCMIDDYGLADGSYPPFLRCDIREMTTPLHRDQKGVSLIGEAHLALRKKTKTGHRMCFPTL